MVGERINLIAHHHPTSELMPYERLLGDAMRGDPSLFAREDSVEEAWRVVDPILGTDTSIFEYEPNTWGPPEASRIIANDDWHNPAQQDRT